MNGKSSSPPAGGGTSAPPASDDPDDISNRFPLSLCRSQLIPPAPNNRKSAIDFLYDFGGSSWIAYGASSLLVISHFPSPLPAHESLVGPFFRQVIDPSTCGDDDGTAAVNAVSWCPVRPSEGEVAAAQGNLIRLYAPRPDNNTGSFCWGQTAGILQSSMVEAIEWTGSGDGIIAAGIEVVFWRRRGRSWVMAWKSVADVPQVMVSATWSAEGFVASSAGCLFTRVENSPYLANGDCKHVSVYQNCGNSEVLKMQLYHPQPISLIRWRPSTSIRLTNGNLHAWRDVLLTCCLDGTVRLWSGIDNGRSKKLIEGIDHRMIKSFQVVAIIEIEQCLSGTLGTDIFIDWAADMGSVILTSKEDDYSISPAGSRLDNVASCEWLISVGPGNSVTFWAIHCLDDVVTLRSPRVTLWTKRNPADFHAGHFSFYLPPHLEENPIFVKVVVSRSHLFGPPVACSLLQLLPGNSMNWWYFYSPSIDDVEQKSLIQVSKERCLSHFAAGVLNLDGHTAKILQLALHPYSYELELAVSLDSNGFLLFWSLPRNFNCALEIQMYAHPTWKLLGKVRSQDLSVDLKYLTMAWVPLVLDEKPLLLLGYADGIDCFLINVAGEGNAISCCKIFSLSFAGHNHAEGTPDQIFATPFPSFPSSFLFYAVWMKEFKALSWKVVLQSEDLTGSSSALSSDSESFSRPENISDRISCNGRRYSAVVSSALWNFPDLHNSKSILCVSVVTLDHSILHNEKHVVSDNDSCGNSCSLMATGYSDGILQLWKQYSAKSSESEFIPWLYVGEFAAHDGPVHVVSLSNCGTKVATVNVGGKNCTFTLHIWTPICFIGGGSFILEDVLLLNGPVVALKWSTIGNGKLLLGVCMPNEFHIYCQRRAHNEFLESDKSEEKHTWYCISISHSHHPCHEFLWGPMLTPVLLHENKISIFSEWLCETEYKHIGDSSIVTEENLCCDISLKNNGHGAKELKKRVEKENGIFLDVLSSGSFMKNTLDTRKRLHNLMDIVEKLCGPLESYHPWALLQYLYRGNWKRAYIVLKHLVDSLKSSGSSTTAVESCNSGNSSHIPQIPLAKYLEGTTPRESESSTSHWGQGNNFVSEMSEKNAFLVGEETLKSPSLTAYPKSEIMHFIEILEMAHNLTALTCMERIQILTVLEVLLEVGQTTLYESLDEPARRFWVALRFQHFHFIRKEGKVADAEQHAIESWLVVWAFQSDSQENLLNSVLSAEPSWPEMRNLGLGFWFTNVSHLRARMEKLARLQYLKSKNPKDCALLYLALNRLHVLAGLFKISKDEKDKVLFKFLSRNFQEEKNKAAALKNAYVLMGRHQVELAVAFFLLGGEPFSAVTVCAKNLGDEQLALVICRLLEGFGGPLEHQLITNTLLPNAIMNKDYWLSSLLEWSLGNYSKSVKRLFEPLGHSTNHTAARKCAHVSLADPNIGRYCVVLASKHCLRNSIGDYQATLLSKFATMMDSYSLDRFGLPLEALECFASSTMKGNTDLSSEYIETHDIFQVLLNPFSTAISTRTWLQEGFACHLEFNLRFSLAMQYISRLLQEFSCCTYKNSAVFPDLVKHYHSEIDGDDYQIEEFRDKLNLVILVFERRYSLKLIDLANMVLHFARNSGLLFLGYQLMLGNVFLEHEVDNQHKTRHSTVCSVLLRLLVQASKQLFCVFSRYIVSCHLSDSALKLLSGSASTEENYDDYHFQRCFCLRSLICSLWIIKPLLKYYDDLLVTEGLTLSTYSLLELVEYMMNFSYNWFSRNFRGLIQMLYQTRKASLSHHDSIEAWAGKLMKILYRNTCEALNDDAEVLRDFIRDKKQVEQNESSALSIPEDVRRLLMGTSLWIHNNSFTNQHLSNFLGTEKFATGRTTTDHNQFSVLFAEVTMASISYISSSLTRQLASFLRKKASQDLPVATFSWLGLTNHCEFSSLPHVDLGVYIRQLSSSEDREVLFERIWAMSVSAKEIYQSLLNERVYGFTYKSQKLLSWNDFLKVNLSDNENRIRRDSNPKFEIVNFINPREIVKRSGELLEAISCNSIDEQQLAVSSNRKGLLFLDWKMEPSRRVKPLLIWPEADWPLNGCTSFEDTPVSTCGSQDGLLSKTGLRNHVKAENVCSQSLCSHPSRPFLLVGSINTHIHLWEFGKEKSTAIFGVLPAVTVPPHAHTTVSSLDFDHCGHRFASAALDGTVCTWQLGVEGRNNVSPTESTVCFTTHASDVSYVAARGSILAAAGCSTNGQNVVLWDTLAPPSTSQASLFCHEGGASSVAVFDSDIGTGSFSPIIVTGGKTGDVGLHDFRYVTTRRSKPHQQPRDRDFKPSKIIDSSQHVDSTNGMIWYIPKAHLGSITRIKTIPNTSMFLTGSQDGDVKLWDANTAQLVFHWQRIHDRHTFIQPTSRSIGGIVRAAVTDIKVFSHGFLTCGADGSVKLVQLK